jgi:glycosyltransferase 2 family protein
MDILHRLSSARLKASQVQSSLPRSPLPATRGNGLATSLPSPTSTIDIHLPQWLRSRIAGRSLTVAFALILTAAALYWSAKGVSRRELGVAFRDVNWWWVVAAVVANAVNVVAQGWAWRIGLRAGGVGDVPLRHAVSATWIGKAGNQLLPGRVGEIARIAILRRHVPSGRGQLPRIIGSLIAQRAFAITATLLAVVGAALSLPIPIEIPGGRFAPLGGLLAVVAAVTFAQRAGLWRRLVRILPQRVRRVSEALISGGSLMRPSRSAGHALGLHLIALAAQLSTMGFLLRAFEISAPITAPLMIVALVAVAGAIPSAPGGLGVNQIAIVAPLGASYGVPASAALAFSLGLQATVALVAVVGGVIALAHQRLSRPAARVQVAGHFA